MVSNKGVHRARPASGFDDLPGHREDFVWLAIEELAYREVAFGEPWTVIEKLRGFEKRRKIDFGQGAAQPLDGAQHCIKQLLAVAIVEKLELIGARHTEPAALDLAPRGRARRIGVPREWIGGVETFDRLQNRRRVIHRQRKDGQTVERTARRQRAARADEAARRL